MAPGISLRAIALTSVATLAIAIVLYSPAASDLMTQWVFKPAAAFLATFNTTRKFSTSPMSTRPPTYFFSHGGVSLVPNH